MDGFKQRLIGALVLISLAVIFVPMLLDEPHEERTSRNIEIPEEPDFPEVRIEPAEPPATDRPIRAVPEPETSPLETASPERQAPAPTSPMTEETVDQAGQGGDVDSPDRPSRADTAQPAEGALPAPEPVLEPVEPVAPVPQAPAAPEAGGYLVQLGSFGSQSNADRLKDSVEGAGFNAFTTQIESAGNTYTRVIAGPFGDKDAADAAKLKLDNLFGLNTLVIANDR